MNICSWLERNAERAPEKAAIVFEGRTITHSRILDSVRRFGNALKALGVAPGDRVALLLPNCPQFLIARWGAIAIGAVSAPFNMMFQKSEALNVLNNVAPRVLVTVAEKLPLIEDIWVECPSLEHVVVIDGPAVHGTHAFNDLLADSGDGLDLHDCRPDDLCDLYFTSGTTGRPKGVGCSHSNFEHLLKFETIVWDMRSDDLVLTALPLFHAKGLIIPSLLASYTGATQYLMQRWDTETVLQTIHDRAITVFVGVPTMYSYILAHPRVDAYNLKSLRLCRVGGAPIPIEVHSGFERRTGVKIIEGYGCTGWVGTSHPLAGNRVIGSIGKALGELHPDIDCQIRIVDADDNDVATGDEGELVIRGPQIPKGFWRLPAKTATDYRNGWFHTGDIARKDADGFIFLVGRKDDLIITSGFNVYPREIEEALYEHGAILEVAVVGTDDDAKGQIITAFVVLKDGCRASAGEIMEHCRERIASYKVPRLVEFVGSLPKTSSGKVQRRLLRTTASATANG
ncbi:MAG: AMP-binding protein [Roseovarius sp.]|nr:AMP-binding protein [Roseovarius sp.]